MGRELMKMNCTVTFENFVLDLLKLHTKKEFGLSFNLLFAFHFISSFVSKIVVLYNVGLFWKS